MGNSISSNPTTSPDNQFENVYDIVDYIATKYILTTDFTSLRGLTEQKYCDNLIILTSDIIQRYFNDMEITYLDYRVKNGLDVNQITKDNIVFIDKDHLESLDIKNDKQKNIKKKRVCMGIAKFYIKIAHIFASIVMTINPIYMYKDEFGNTIKKGLLQKDTIPKNTRRQIYKLNICDDRIKALRRGIDQDNPTTNDTVKLHPNICDFNTDKSGVVKTLQEEPGIYELSRLYLDDNYNFATGEFTGMSEKTSRQFMNDLKIFYTAFTGMDSMPQGITRFSDIQLRDYTKTAGCTNNRVYNQEYSINKNDKLFIDYANNLNKMIQTANENQQKLLECINDIFTYVIDPFTKKRRIRINPKLNDELLQQVVEKARKYIMNLYVTCEIDYINGIKIFEKIVEKKILETTQNQLAKLGEMEQQITDSIPIKP